MLKMECLHDLSLVVRGQIPAPLAAVLCRLKLRSLFLNMLCASPPCKYAMWDMDCIAAQNVTLCLRPEHTEEGEWLSQFARLFRFTRTLRLIYPWKSELGFLACIPLVLHMKSLRKLIVPDSTYMPNVGQEAFCSSRNVKVYWEKLTTREMLDDAWLPSFPGYQVLKT